jgi:hypothetical protein
MQEIFGAIKYNAKLSGTPVWFRKMLKYFSKPTKEW